MGDLNVANLVAKLKADTAEFSAKMLEANESVKKFSEDGQSKVGALTGAFKMAALGVAGLALSVGTESIHLADAFEKPHAALQQALKNTGGSYDKLRAQISTADAQAEKFGYTNAQTEDALASLTTGLGSGKAAVAAMGEAEDIAAAKHENLAAAAQDVVKIHAGATRALKDFGISTDDLNGYLKTHAGVSKEAAANDLILAKIHGQAAAQADTFAGKTAELKAQVEDAGKNLGLWLIPKLEEVITWLEQGVTWVQKHKQSFIDAWNSIKGVVLPVVSWLGDRFTDIKGWLDDNSKKWDDNLGPNGKVKKTMDAFVGIFKPAFEAVKGLFNDVVTVVQDLWDRFGKRLLDHLKTTFDAIVQELKGAFEIIKGVFEIFAGIFTGKWSEVWKGIKDVFKGVWDMISGIAKEGINAVSTAIGGGMAVVSAIWGGAWHGISTAVSAAWDNVKSGVSAAVGWVEGKIGDLVAFFKDIPNKIGNLGADILKKIVPDIPGASIIQGGLKAIGGMLAEGGPAAAGVPYVIGERGPELFVPNVAGTVVPNSIFSSGAGGGPGSYGGGAGNTYSITVNVAAGADPSEVGRQTVEAIRAYERRSGASWRAA